MSSLERGCSAVRFEAKQQPRNRAFPAQGSHGARPTDLSCPAGISIVNSAMVFLGNADDHSDDYFKSASKHIAPVQFPLLHNCIRELLTVMKVLFISSLIAAMSFTPTASFAQNDNFGKFVSNPIVEFIEDGKVKLANEVAYIDPKGRKWKAPIGYVSNGASIPQLFYTPVGGPLSGNYRDAALIHDYYCEKWKVLWPDKFHRDWREVHRTFYYAMRARGVSSAKAKLMYAAVFIAGPRWTWQNGKVRELNLVERALNMYAVPETKKMAQQAEQYIKQNDPTLDQIDELLHPIERLKNLRKPGPWAVGTHNP